MCRRSVVCAIVCGLIALLAIPDNAPAGEAMRATVDANSVSVDAGAVKIAEYRYGDVPFKPYIKELFTPNGLNVLLDAPHDHLHHHALMFAVAVDGVNFWEETPQAGVQRGIMVRDVTEANQDAPAVALADWLNWVDPVGEKLLAETRVIHVARRRPPEPTVLTWESRLSTPRKKSSVTLSGSHYFGLGLRFIPAMDAKGTFRNADSKPGTVFRGEERLVRSNWCAYTAQVDGDDVTVAMFGHPDNPRSPTTWFTMAKPFAYLSATLGLHEKPLEIIEGKPVQLRYAVVLWDRLVESEEIDRQYQQWQK